MTDYTELIRSLRNCSNNRCTPCDCGWFDKYQVDESCKEIIMWKAADAIEALQAQLPKRGQYVHGRELSREYIGDCLVSIDYEDWRCSVCGIVFEQWSMPTYNYCPNCGAKMREVQE